MKLNSKQKSSAVNASVTYEHDNLQPLKTKVSIYLFKRRIWSFTHCACFTYQQNHEEKNWRMDIKIREEE